jgi:hypothetical protein
MPCQTHPFLRDDSTYIWRREQLTQLLVMQFPPLTRPFIHLRSKYSPENPVLIHVQYMTNVFWDITPCGSVLTRATRCMIQKYERFQIFTASVASYGSNCSYVRFEVFTAVTMKNGVFWDVMPCGSCILVHRFLSP